MGNRPLFEWTLLFVLGLMLVELLWRRSGLPAPNALQWSGTLLSIVSIPWSVLALELFRATTSPITRVLRDFAFMLLMAAGVSVNVLLLRAAVTWIIRLFRGTRRPRSEEQ